MQMLGWYLLLVCEVITAAALLALIGCAADLAASLLRRSRNVVARHFQVPWLARTRQVETREQVQRVPAGSASSVETAVAAPQTGGLAARLGQPLAGEGIVAAPQTGGLAGRNAAARPILWHDGAAGNTEHARPPSSTGEVSAGSERRRRRMVDCLDADTSSGEVVSAGSERHGRVPAGLGDIDRKTLEPMCTPEIFAEAKRLARSSGVRMRVKDRSDCNLTAHVNVEEKESLGVDVYEDGTIGEHSLVEEVSYTVTLAFDAGRVVCVCTCQLAAAGPGGQIGWRNRGICAHGACVLLRLSARRRRQNGAVNTCTVNDYYLGVPIRHDEPYVACANCGVRYRVSTWEELSAQTAGRCMNCNTQRLTRHVQRI